MRSDATKFLTLVRCTQELRPCTFHTKMLSLSIGEQPTTMTTTKGPQLSTFTSPSSAAITCGGRGREQSPDCSDVHRGVEELLITSKAINVRGLIRSDAQLAHEHILRADRPRRSPQTRQEPAASARLVVRWQGGQPGTTLRQGRHEKRRAQRPLEGVDEGHRGRR
uniref:Uncharacterized protein n=1 Tax=Arundo donax TaxID=35708 RepID=A0A0A9B0Y9_ARUDO